jgi:DNA-binding NarL/FixJ family response regulator
MIRVLLAEDQAMVRGALSALRSAQPGEGYRGNC